MKNGGFANKDAALFFVECGRRAIAPPSEPPLPPRNFPDSNISCFRMQPILKGKRIRGNYTHKLLDFV